MRWLGVAVVAAMAVAGCGSRCREIADNRAAFFARRAPPTTTPHVAALVPFALLDAQIAARLTDVQPIALPLPALGPLARLGQLRVVPRRVTLLPAAPGHVGFRLDLDVMDDADLVFSTTANADAEPTLTPRGGLLELRLLPRSLSAIRLTLGPDARVGLAAAIGRHLPATVRLLVRPAQLEAVAAKVVDWLGGRTLDQLLGPRMLAHLGEVTHLRFRFGPRSGAVPIAALGLSSRGDAATGGLALTARFDLPVRAGLATGVDRGPASDVVATRISGSAAAELANWAIRTHAVPERYDGSWHPKAGGAMSPGFDWLPGARPLKIYAWRLTSPCMRARIGAVPILGLEPGSDQLHVELGDPVVEDVIGNILVQARMWFYAVSFNRDVLAHSELSMGGRRLQLAIVSAAADAGGLAFDFRVTPAPVPSAAK